MPDRALGSRFVQTFEKRAPDQAFCDSLELETKDLGLGESSLFVRLALGETAQGESLRDS